MKNVFKVAAITAGLMMTSGVANAVENIGFINVSALIQNHPLAQNPDPQSVKYIQEQEKKLTAEEDSIVKKIELLKKEAPKLRSADIKKRQDAINVDRKAFEQKAAEFEKHLAETQNKVRNEILTSIQTNLDQVATAKGYTLVLDTNMVVFAKNAENDITEAVYKAITTPKEAPEAKPQAQAEPAAQQPAAK